MLERILRPGDLCLTLGAGDLTTLPDRFLGSADAQSSVDDQSSADDQSSLDRQRPLEPISGEARPGELPIW